MPHYFSVLFTGASVFINSMIPGALPRRTLCNRIAVNIFDGGIAHFVPWPGFILDHFAASLSEGSHDGV